MEIPQFIQPSISLRHTLLNNIPLGSLTLGIEAISSPGSKLKPNEDNFVFGVDKSNRLFAAVFDGVSSQVDIPGLKEWGVSGGVFASSFLRENFQEFSELDLKGAFVGMNKRLRNAAFQIDGIRRCETAFWPASTGTAVRIDPQKQTLELAHVGDSFLAIEFANEKREVLTDDRNKQFDDELIKRLILLAKNSGTSPRGANDYEEMIEAKKASFRFKMNNPQRQGIGIFNGDPNIELYIQHQDRELGEIMFALLGTDGIVTPNLDIRNLDGLDHIMNLAKTQGVLDLVKYRDYITGLDPKWSNFPRLKQCDDGTGILLAINRN